MKKILKYLSIIFIAFLFLTPAVSSLTINDYVRELNKLKEEKRKQDEADAKTQAEIEAAKQRMVEINNDIRTTTETITKTEEEIKELEHKIEVKNSQIKDLVSFLQISDSENFYLKYIFGAENFTDLIYRISVIEQLTTKSDELIKEMNSLITENKQKIVDLEAKKEELKKLNSEVLNQITMLGKERDSYFDEVESIEEQIASAEKQIEQYRKLGCKDNEDLSTCTSMIPSSSGFIRPTKSGIITDNYGWRVDPCAVCSEFHKGVDIGGNNEGTAVYASAAGKVVDISKYSCGGKVLTIDHNIKGKPYATRYWHLYKIVVKEGEYVAQGQKVAEVGGGGTAYYDSCSTGPHLHFEVVKGNYYSPTYLDNVQNPNDYVDFPGGWW